MHGHLNVKNKTGATALKHVAYLLKYRTRLQFLLLNHHIKNWGGGIALELPTKFNIFCE